MRSGTDLRNILFVGLPPVVVLSAALWWGLWNRGESGTAKSTAVAVMAFSLAVLWLVGTTFVHTRRLQRARRALLLELKAMERGDYSRRAPSLDSDELADLVLAFHDAREQVARRVAELLENRDQMAAVLGGMVEGVLAVDAQCRVLLANDACRALLAIPARDLFGRPLLEVARNLDVQQHVSAALAGQDPAAREIPVATDSRRMLRVLATRLPGEPCPGAVVVLHDVSELRRLENLRREFVANVSHELKTPLSSIKAYAETLRMGAIHDPDHNLAFVERIEEQATRLHRLILDLLHLARVETGQEAFEFVEVSLEEACRTCAAHHAGAAEAAGVSLNVQGTEDTRVWADADGIRIILDNLVSNAVKFTPRGGQVTVRYRREGDLGVLEVEDTGIGIELQHQQRIFERFYRVDRARSRDLGGTGLGLAIVKHLCQAFGGDVRMSSTPGRGSLFQARLPQRALSSP